ncbi:MAG: hypothetical protein WCS52_18185 [bacterium]
MKRDATLLEWNSGALPMGAIIAKVSTFNARGMRRIYCRGDRFGRGLSFNLDIWKTREGRVLMSCWTRCECIEDISFEIRGIPTGLLPENEKTALAQDDWVPESARIAYDRWIQDNL